MQPESRSCVQPGVRQLFMECGCDSELSSNTSPDEHIKEVLASAMSLQIEMGTVWSFVFDLQSGVRTVKIACRPTGPSFYCVLLWEDVRPAVYAFGCAHSGTRQHSTKDCG